MCSCMGLWCVCVCVHTCVVCTCVYLYLWYVCVYICAVCLCLCMWVCGCFCVSMCLYIMYACVFVWVYACVCGVCDSDNLVQVFVCSFKMPSEEKCFCYHFQWLIILAAFILKRQKCYDGISWLHIWEQPWIPSHENKHSPEQTSVTCPRRQKWTHSRSHDHTDMSLHMEVVSIESSVRTQETLKSLVLTTVSEAVVT